MTHAFTHHLRCLPPAEELQRDLPLHGATVPVWIYPATVVFALMAVVAWSGS